MIQHSIYILFRKFTKEPLFSVITLSNLALGFATFILLSLFLQGMLSYDKHNKNYDRIYRVQIFKDQKGSVLSHSWSITAALSRNELTRIPEIEKIMLMHDAGDNNKNGIFLSPDRKNQFLVRYGYYTDQTVFDIFTFHFLEGDPNRALTQPNSVVLSKSVADRLFPGENATGKQIYAENKVVLTVTGVYEDIPDRSHWQPAYLLPMLSFAEFTGWRDYEDNYWAYSFYTYVLLKPNADPHNVDAKIDDALKNFRKEHHPYLRPMSQLYIRAYFDNDMIVALVLFGFIAILILVLSSINYINLQTANASTRFREIGVKKAVGFSKKDLWFQFMFEFMAIALTGAFLGVLIAQVAYPAFNKLIGGNILPGIFDDWKLLAYVTGVALIAGFLSSLHPSYVISRFNPVAALKQKLVNQQSNGISLKKVLVTLQFSISIYLLAVGFIVYRQTHYMLTKDMGFESNNLLFANITTNKKGSFESLRERLLSHSEIAEVCKSDYIPFILPGGDELNWEGASDPEEKVFVRFYNVSYDYVPTFNLKIIKGRNFSRDFPDDYHKCLLNETAVDVFGWEDPVGRSIKIHGKDYQVIGIIKDYVAFSVHNKLEPHLIRLMPDSILNDKVYSIRYKPGSEKKAMQICSQEFENFFNDDAFEFKNIQFRIKTENAVVSWGRLMKISIFFAGLSIIISSICLFGLMLFFTRNKLKETGIRKVLGFNFMHLYFNMSSGFLKLFAISMIIAWPSAYYVYKSLPGADKYPIQIWEFIAATLITLSVAIITMSYQIIKAVRVKPVDILKDE